MKLRKLKAAEAEPLRYSERVTLERGDLFRAIGGPTYRSPTTGDVRRVGEPGRYRMIGTEIERGRTYVVAQPIDACGLPTGGTRTLLVQGSPYRLRELPNWTVRPYRIVKMRLDPAAVLKAVAKEKRKAKAK